MNQPVGKTWCVEELCEQLATAEREADACRRELEEARETIRKRLTGISIQQPYQLLRHYYEKLLEDEKRKRREDVDELNAKLKEQKRCSDEKVAGLEALVAELRSQLAMYKDQVNGSGKSERFHGDTLGPRSGERTSKKNKDAEANQKKADDKVKKGPRVRSKKSGGRRIPKDMPRTTVVHELPPEDCRCPFCGKAFYLKPFTQAGGTVIEMQITFTITTHEQACYESTCTCNIPKLHVAPRPPRAMKKSLYSDRLWLNLLLMKFSQQIPTNRCIEWLAMHGLNDVSPSTVCEGFPRMATIFSELDGFIIDHNREAAFWLADESGIKVFVKREEREGRHWAVWQIRSCDTVVYMLSSTQEANNILSYFAEAPNGEVLLSDRAQTFKTLDIWFAIAFCWAHMRRDFVRVGRYVKGNRTWAIQWLRRIRKVYRIYQRRKKEPPDSAAHRKADQELRESKASIRAVLDAELSQEGLNEKRKKVLNSLDRHWDGLWRFVEDMRLPIDNNETERGFRPIARFRHSSYGCHSEDSANHLTRFYTILQTLKMNKIPELPYLEAYMAEYAANDAKIPDIKEWAPWDLSERVQSLIAHN
jgi:transposase